MSGQPDYGVAVWKFDFADLTARESSGRPPSMIINSTATTTLTLESHLTNEGPSGYTFMVPGTAGTINYFATKIGGPVGPGPFAFGVPGITVGTTIELAPTTFTMNAVSLRVASNPFNTWGPGNPALPPAVATLEPGVWKIQAIVTFPTNSNVCGFNEITVIVRAP